MASIAQFSKNIRTRKKQFENGSKKVIVRATKRALRSLVLGTPVDTGQARSNWRVGIGAPTRAVIPPYSPGSNLGISERANASAAINAGYARIDSLPPGPVTKAIYITNAVHYIGRLNAGHSKQAPAGFVEKALLEASSEVQNFRYFVSSNNGD